MKKRLSLHLNYEIDMLLYTNGMGCYMKTTKQMVVRLLNSSDVYAYLIRGSLRWGREVNIEGF